MRSVTAGWAGWTRAHPLLCLIFIENRHLLNHFLSINRIIFGLIPHIEEASNAPGNPGETTMCMVVNIKFTYKLDEKGPG